MVNVSTLTMLRPYFEKGRLNNAQLENLLNAALQKPSQGSELAGKKARLPAV